MGTGSLNKKSFRLLHAQMENEFRMSCMLQPLKETSFIVYEHPLSEYSVETQSI